MKKKVVVIGGKGTAVVIAEQIYDANVRFGVEIEVLGFAFDGKYIRIRDKTISK